MNILDGRCNNRKVMILNLIDHGTSGNIDFISVKTKWRYIELYGTSRSRRNI